MCSEEEKLLEQMIYEVSDESTDDENGVFDDDSDYTSSENSDIPGNVSEHDSSSTSTPIHSRKRCKSDFDGDWTDADEIPDVAVYTGPHGVKQNGALDESSEPLDVFFYFFDSALITDMKEQTDCYARQKLAKLRSDNKLLPSSRLKQWKTVTIAEMKKFVAILLHMTISERPDMKSHWSTDPVVSCNFCPSVLSRDRFINILSMFHLNDNKQAKKKGEEGYDALYKVRPLLNSMKEKFQSIYYPEEAVTVYEGICPFRGRIGFKVCLANKPNKYDMKLYVLAESRTGFIWNFEVYHGEDEEQDNSVSSVVMCLTSKLLGKGHTVYVNRVYTSVQLAEQLAKENTGLVGMVMMNGKGLPKALKEAKLRKGEQVFRRKGNVLALRWKDKRDVWMISTRHAATMQSVTTRKSTEKMKPAAIIDYNQHKVGMDLFDQQLLYGALDHKTVKWWRKMAFYCIVMAVSNACILHNIITKKKLTTTKFIQIICQGLVLSVGESTESFPRGSGTVARLSEKHFPNRVTIPEGKKKGQRRCVVCSEKEKFLTGKAGRKDTSFECTECNVGLCISPCFKLYHTVLHFQR